MYHNVLHRRHLFSLLRINACKIEQFTRQSFAYLSNILGIGMSHEHGPEDKQVVLVCKKEKVYTFVSPLEHSRFNLQLSARKV